jgi:protein-tyrosine phosphatase
MAARSRFAGRCEAPGVLETASGNVVQPVARVLFVCLGNICRSPTAEGVFRSAVARAGLADVIHIDSAAIGDWQVGQPPDRRAINAARRRGYDIDHLRARQVSTADFDWILAMDRANLRALQRMRPRDFSGYLGLFLDFVPEMGLREVPDPYHSDADVFEQVLDLTERASIALLAAVQDDIARRPRSRDR